MLGNNQFRIYIHKDISSPYFFIETKSLYKVLTLNWQINGTESGIPSELVEKIYDDHSGLAIEYAPQNETKKLDLAYVSAPGTDELQDLVRIIGALNEMTETNISIFCAATWHRRLRHYANEHIQFVATDLNSGRKLKKKHVFQLVITFGSGALHFIRQGFPVIVAGAFGYGGLMTPDNFPYLLREGFMGRPGGFSGEPIPAALLLQDLHWLKSQPGLDGIVAETKELANRLPYKPLSKAGDWKDGAIRLKSDLHHKEARWRLKPRLASNLTIFHEKDLSYVKRKDINDILAIINRQKFPILDMISGTLDCRTLQQSCQLSASVFWQHMEMLRQKNIILFDPWKEN